MASYYRAISVVRDCGKQDKKVSELEAERMRAFREMGFSIGLLSYIFNRSKSTIHFHVLNLQ